MINHIYDFMTYINKKPEINQACPIFVVLSRSKANPSSDNMCQSPI